MELPEKKYPVDAKDYNLYEEIGEGVSATVYRALCIPFNEIVAIKVLDLERCSNDLVRAAFYPRVSVICFERLSVKFNYCAFLLCFIFLGMFLF